MKTTMKKLCIMLTLFVSIHQLDAQGTAFTYQGRLNDGANPANGNYNMFFQVYDAATVGNDVGDMSSINVSVTNGLFTVALDFGSGVFTGAPRWLSIGVRTNGASLYTTLAPRQLITPTPYAMYAPSAGVASGVSASAAIQAQSLNIGTNNNLNSIYSYSSISGGYSNNVNGSYSIIAGGYGNSISNNVATIGGGYQNIASGNFSTIAGGQKNAASGDLAFVGGGLANIASNNAAIVGGGSDNIVTGDHGAIVGGEFNTSSGTHAFIGGGSNNVAASDEDVVVGGINNSVSGDPAFIGAGVGNKVGSFNGIGFSGIALNSWIVAGASNTVVANNSGIGGGAYNLIQSNANYSFIGGGQANFIVALTNGSSTNLSSQMAVWSTIPGGYSNSVNGSYALAAGRRAKANYDGDFVWADSQDADFPSSAINQFLIRAAYGVGINKTNPICALDVAGTIQGTYIQGTSGLSGSSTSGNGVSGSSISGNAVYGNSSSGTAIYGVSGSSSFGKYGVYGSGPNGVYGVDSLGNGAGVSGTSTGGYGVHGSSTSNNGVYGGSSSAAGVAGVSTSGSGVHGISTSSTGVYGESTSGNGVQGSASAAGAYGVYAVGATSATGLLAINSPGSGYGCYIGTPSYAADCYGPFRCQGTSVVFSSGGAGANQTVSWSPGSASWSFTSDRNLKDRFKPVNAQLVLDKISKLPLTEWSYKGYGQRHIGPMAQDFHALFPLNDSDKTLNDVDLHGVALAAIQGLNQKLDEKDAEIQELKKSVDDLKTMVQSLAEKK